MPGWPRFFTDSLSRFVRHYFSFVLHSMKGAMPIEFIIISPLHENGDAGNVLFCHSLIKIQFIEQKSKLSLCLLQANDNGDFFPIWGTCMGMQLLTVLVAGKSLLEKTTAENVALHLNLTSG